MGSERDAERDQRLPQVAGGPIIHTLVQDDLGERLAFGIRKYGVGLQAHNGRNAGLDAYEEVLDLAVYLKTLLVEREDMLTLAKGVKTHLESIYKGQQPTPTVVQQARLLVDWLEA